MATRTETVNLVKQLLQISTSSVSATDIGEAVDKAVEQYSKDVPREVVSQFVGVNKYDYDISNYLSSWVDDFSVIKEIEYPVGDQTKNLIEDIDWEIYEPDTSAYTMATAASAGTQGTLSSTANYVYFQEDNCVYLSDGTNSQVNWLTANASTAGVLTFKNALDNDYTTVTRRKCLRFPYYTPDSDEVVAVRYTTYPHTLDDSTDTIPTGDYLAVAYLSAAMTALFLSAKYAKSSDSSISADTVDYLSKSEQWKTVAEEYFKQYNDHIGQKEDSEVGSSHTKDWDTFYMWGTDRLFHNRRWR